MGARRQSRNSKLKDLRSWPISGYRNYLVFYIALDREIDVLRVVHGARDVDQLIERTV